jgi:hypothetical protein
MKCRCLPSGQLRAAVTRSAELTIRICSSISGRALVHRLSALTWTLTITPRALRHFDLLSSRAERHSARFGFGIWESTEDWSDGSCLSRWSRMGRWAVVGSVPNDQLSDLGKVSLLSKIPRSTLPSSSFTDSLSFPSLRLELPAIGLEAILAARLIEEDEEVSDPLERFFRSVGVCAPH